MALAQFLHTLRRIHCHPGSSLGGMLRHLGWQLRRQWIHRPYKVKLSEISSLYVDSPAAANGTTALTWSLGKYDYNNMSLIQELMIAVNGPRVMLDIGANVGTYALIGSENPEALVHAFEPHPVTSEILARNLKHNSRSNVVVSRMALSSEAKIARFTDSAGSTVNKLVDSGGPNMPVSPESPAVVVECVTADAYCQAAGIKPTVIKLDVEGHEAEVLAGMAGVLSEAGILFVEVNHEMDELTKLIPSNWLGPWLVDFTGRKFCQRTNKEAWEDTVFVSPAFAVFLNGLGYSMPEQ